MTQPDIECSSSEERIEATGFSSAITFTPRFIAGIKFTIFFLTVLTVSYNEKPLKRLFVSGGLLYASDKSDAEHHGFLY